MSKLNSFFLAIGETRHPLTFYQRRAFVDGLVEDCGGMTNRGNWLARIIEGFDQSDRDGIVDEVPHRTVPADIENRVVVLCFYVGYLIVCDSAFCATESCLNRAIASV